MNYDPKYIDNVLGIASVVACGILLLAVVIARISKDKLDFERFLETFFFPIFMPVGSYFLAFLFKWILKMDVDLKRDAFAMCPILIISAVI